MSAENADERKYPVWLVTTLTGGEFTVEGRLEVQYPMIQIVQGDNIRDIDGNVVYGAEVQFIGTLDNVFVVRAED